jgi:hypothetical protein
MKYKYFSILYLAIILLYLLSPVLPYFDYIIRRDYIVKNLCVEKENPVNTCQGKCYLHEQLNKSSEEMNDDGNDKENKISSNRIGDHLRAISVDLIIFPEESPLAGYYCLPGITSFASDIFVPPRD